MSAWDFSLTLPLVVCSHSRGLSLPSQPSRAASLTPSSQAPYHRVVFPSQKSYPPSHGLLGVLFCFLSLPPVRKSILIKAPELCSRLNPASPTPLLFFVPRQSPLDRNEYRSGHLADLIHDMTLTSQVPSPDTVFITRVA